MRTFIFSKRNTKEILRDPINLFFGLAFPLILMFLFTAINSNIPKEAQNTMFAPEQMVPGVAVFGTVFMALFSGVLLSNDRASSFLMRLYSSPMSSVNFIMGYTLPMIIMALVQSIITFSVALIIGFPLTFNIFIAIAAIIPVTLLFIGTGLLCGSLMNSKAVGGFCGALLTNLAGWFSGIWFPLDLLGGTFKVIANFLPFYHSAEAVRAGLAGNFKEIFLHLSVVLLYTIIIFLFAIFVFRKRMSRDKA